MKFSNKKTISIDAPVNEVWQALTDPEMIKQYFFGVETTGDWKEGHTIIHKGLWKGKEYRGLAKVLEIEDQKLLKHSYWSDMSGLPDIPENYHIITYQLAEENDKTRLTLTEENLADETMKGESSKLWDMVFENLKKLLEKERVGSSNSEF